MVLAQVLIQESSGVAARAPQMAQDRHMLPECDRRGALPGAVVTDSDRKKRGHLPGKPVQVRVACEAAEEGSDSTTAFAEASSRAEEAIQDLGLQVYPPLSPLEPMT